MPEEIQIETRPQPAYALLSFSDYFKINKQLSEAKGYQIGNATERVNVMNPRAAKINRVFDAEGIETDYEGVLVLPVSSKQQIDYPQVFEGLELVKTYIPVDNPLDYIDILNLDEQTMFWIAEHCIRTHVTFDGLVLTLNAELLQYLPEEIIEAINQLGVTLIFE